MKFAKDMALVAAGIGAVIMYQKYSQPVMKKIKCLVDNTMEQVNEKLDDMME